MESNKIKILAIDDNFDNLITIQALITETFSDADVVLSTSGREGIMLAQAERPDVILLDVVMPEMDGYEVCERLKSDANLCDVPVVFVTALKGDKESRIRGLEVGAEAFLAKPIDESELVAQVRAMIKINRANLDRRQETVRLMNLVNERTHELKSTHAATLNLLEDLKAENEMRRQTEEALKASEELYRSVIQASPDNITVANLDGVVTMISPKGLQLIGYADEKLVLGRNLIEFIIPEHRERAIGNIEGMFKGIFLGSEEYTIIKSDGSTVDTEINAEFVRDGNGEPTRLVFAIRDITERKLAQKALARSEQQYRLITEKISDVVWLMDLEGKSTFVSQSIENFTGYTVDEYLHQSIYERFTEDSARLALQVLHDEVTAYQKANLVRSDFKKILTLEYRCKNGQHKTGELLITPYFNENDELVGVHGVTRDITERKKAQDELLQSEEKFRDMANLLPQVIFEMNLSGEVTYVNQQSKLLFGYEIDELIGQSSVMVHVPEERERVIEGVKLKLEGKSVENKEFTMLRKDGTTFPALIFVNIILKNNIPVGIRGVVIDITEQKKSEEKIRESEEKYRFMAENSSDVIWHMNKDFIFDYVSPAEERMRGYKPEEVEGTTLWSILKPEGINTIQSILHERQAQSDKKLPLNGLQLEFEVSHHDGHYIWAEANVSVHVDEDGNIVGYHGVTRNVTERKRFQTDLLQSEEKYRTLVENSPTGIAIYQEGVFVYVNQSGLKIFGAEDINDLVGRPVLSVVHPDSMPAVIARVSNVTHGGQVPPIEEKLIRFDGSVFDAEVAALATTFNGKPAGQVIVSDITDRKQAQEALIESETRYNTFINNNVDMIFVKDDQFRYLVANESMAKFYGKTVEEILGKTDAELASIDQIYPCSSSDKNALKASGPFTIEEILGERIFETTKFPMILQQNQKGIGGILHDITARKTAEQRLGYVTRLYALLSQINQAIVRIKDIDKLFETVAQLAIEYGQFQMCWIGLYDEKEKTIKPVTFAGHEDGYLDGLNITPFKKPYGKGPTGRSFVEKRLIFCNDIATDPIMAPWKDEALKRGYKASFATPIFRKGSVCGTLTLYASEVNFFKAEEQNLLSEISENLSYAIDAIDSETERISTEQALVASEAKYRDLMDNSPEGITIYVDGKVAYINKEALRLMRAKDKSEMLGKTIVDFIHPDNIELVIERMKLVAMAPLNAILPSVEEKYIRLDGTEVYVEIKVMPILFEGKPAIQLAGHDITDRKEAELALEQSRIELKAIYDNAPVMMCLVDKDRNVQFANNAFLELTGTSEEMLRDGKVGGVVGCLNSFEDPRGCGFGKHCWDCNLRMAMSDTFETGMSHINVEYQSTVIIDGKKHDISLLGSTALINAVGTKSLLLCLHDITDRKLAEDALQKSEMLLRTFIDNSPFEIWARDNDGIGILENKKLVDRFGSIIGSKLHVDERFDQHEVDLFAGINKKAFSGNIIDDEYEFDVNGLKHHYQQIVFPIRNAEKIIGIAGFNIDITEKKMAEKALNESREQLAQFAAHLQNIREEERSSLAREIHDDLGQILIAMKIDIGILKQSVIKSILPEQVETLRLKFEELQHLVDNTLKSARRIMTNLRPEVLDLLGFVETVNQHLKTYEERYGTKCEFVNNALGVELDSTQSVALYRIVQEAFNNIAKHAKATEVKVSLNLVDDALILQIADNGVGFDMGDKKKTDSYGLLGIKERVVLLNGDLKIQSRKNGGTTVQVSFPLIAD